MRQEHAEASQEASHPMQTEISRRSNGDRVVGIVGPKAHELYEAGTPPMWGFAAKPVPSQRVADLKVGDRLRVERQGNRWVVTDAEGELGLLRWLPSDDGRRHAVTGAVIHLPAAGTLHVRQVVIDPSGRVKDIGGYVEPDKATPGDGAGAAFGG